MDLNKKEQQLINKARLHVKSHTANALESLLLKVLDEQIMDISFETFEMYKSDINYSKGLDKFNNLAKCVIDCVNYLQDQNNSGLESTIMVGSFVDEIMINKSEDKGNQINTHKLVLNALEYIDDDKEFSITDIKELADIGIERNDWNQSLIKLERSGIIQRVKRGIYKKKSIN